MNQSTNLPKLRLKLAMAERGLTLGQLGRLADVNRETMKKISGGFGGRLTGPRARVEAVLNQRIWSGPDPTPPLSTPGHAVTSTAPAGTENPNQP